MAQLKIKRGLVSNLPTLAEGELAFTTDEKKVYIGSADGNVQLATLSDVSSIDLSTYAKKTELDNYLPLKGGTCTGGITAPNFQTGTDESAYFQTKKMRGQGTANSYQHAVDWGYSGHNQVDFYEYGGIWNFWQCQSASKTNAVLRGSITNNGYEGSAALTGTPTAPTAAEGTDSTQIATTAFVQAAIGSIPEIEVITNAEIDTIVAA